MRMYTCMNGGVGDVGTGWHSASSSGPFGPLLAEVKQSERYVASPAPFVAPSLPPALLRF